MNTDNLPTDSDLSDDYDDAFDEAIKDGKPPHLTALRYIYEKGVKNGKS